MHPIEYVLSSKQKCVVRIRIFGVINCVKLILQLRSPDLYLLDMLLKGYIVHMHMLYLVTCLIYVRLMNSIKLYDYYTGSDVQYK